eukprot:5931085-Amphidinium_carterae.2
MHIVPGRASVSADTPGHRVGLPWIVYSPQPARSILEDEQSASSAGWMGFHKQAPPAASGCVFRLSTQFNSKGCSSTA